MSTSFTTTGPDFFDVARADTLTEAEQIHTELQQLSEAGCADVLLFPCSGELEQVSLLARALRATGTTSGNPRFVVQGSDLATEDSTHV